MKFRVSQIIIGIGIVTLFGGLLLNHQPTQAQASGEYYVSPDGSPTGDGSKAKPWDLKSTLTNNPDKIKPGSTIWLRGGVYKGTFVSRLSGTPTSPIIVRQYPGERATIDGGVSPYVDDIFLVVGSNTYYWGFEIMSSDPNRQTQEPGPFPYDIKRRRGITFGTNSPEPIASQSGNKAINMIVHDAYNGLQAWNTSGGTEFYGNISFYNGWDASDDQHGHGMYFQNKYPERLVSDNILFDNFGHGIHVYGSDAEFMNYHTLVGNISFNNGLIARRGLANSRDILLNGPNSKLIDNMTYRGQTNFGQYGGCDKGVMTGNYLAGPVKMLYCDPSPMSGNTFTQAPLVMGGSASTTKYPNNTYLTTKSGVKTFVRPNKYEPGRANIAVYNWDKKATVDVDISAAGLKNGDAFQIRNAMNFYGDPVVSGTYSGKPVTLPMTGLSVMPAVGNVSVPPVWPGPEFGAFVVVPGNTVYNTNPNPTPTPTPTATPTPPADTKANVTLTKSVDKTTATPASVLTYTIIARNTSTTKDATQLVVNDVLPAGLQIVTGSATPSATYNSATRTLSWNIGSLAAGASTTLRFQATVQ